MPITHVAVKVKARRVKKNWWFLQVGKLGFWGYSLDEVTGRFLDHVNARTPAANS